MNWSLLEEKWEKLPKELQTTFNEIFNLLTKSESNKSNDIQLKLETIHFLLKEENKSLLNFIERKVQDSEQKISKWEEEQLEIGWKEFEKGKFLSHESVMEKANKIIYGS
ncbi:MAG: hypothetical protein KDK36_08835 [Leptospiraceae bacterium]|nr:hypothetical protein [Leptospiraceae bacterium]